MPLLSLWQLEDETDSPMFVNRISYEVGETFAPLRERLIAMEMIAFPFDFWDPEMKKQILPIVEKWNKIEDFGSNVTVIKKKDMVAKPAVARNPKPLQPLSNLNVDDESWLEEYPSQANASLPPSSFASNEAPSVDNSQTSQPFISIEDNTEASVEEDVSVRCEDSAHEGTGHGSIIQNGSTVISELQLKDWKGLFSRAQQHIAKTSLRDHRWIWKIWDENGSPYCHIQCLECGSNFSSREKGKMDRGHLANLFSNFRTKHLLSPKHYKNWAISNGLPIPNSSDMSEVQATDPKVEVQQGTEIVQKLNDEQEGVVPTFVVLGDLKREPCLPFYYKVNCSYCSHFSTQLVPPKNNLEHQLREHARAGLHLANIEETRKRKHGKALLSGKAGRPGKGEVKDARQKTMQAFFGHDQGRPGHGSDHSQTSKDNGKELILSFLCWGLWRETVNYDGEHRNVKGLLHDQKRGGVWWAEPHAQGQVFNHSSGREHIIDGLFRHEKCKRVSHADEGFHDLTCSFCSTIKLQSSFRLRVLREHVSIDKRGVRDTGLGRRLDYLTLTELRISARKYNRDVVWERKRTRRLLATIARLKTKMPSLRRMVGEGSRRNDVYKVCNSIVLAHKRDVFGGKEAVWDLLKDMALNLNRTAKGKRYSQGTMTICQALFQHGGRRVVECMNMNMLGPSRDTLLRGRRGMTHFRPGINPSQFQLIALVYKKLKERAGIIGDLPCMLAEDETAIKKSVRWVAKTDTLIGFCGAKENHMCANGLEVNVGSGEEGFENIMNAFKDNEIGKFARVIMVNPLCRGMPKLCLMAIPTCNRFDASWVRKQWDSLLSMWNQYCRKDVGPILGHGSDGDGRRRKLMHADYMSMCGVRVSVGWEGWKLSYTMRGDDPYGLHDQDFIHNAKKLINPLDSPVKVMHIGCSIATLEHVQRVYALYTVADHGLNNEDHTRMDRQNWTSAQRLCSRKVQACLFNLQSRRDGKMELTMGTRSYLSICADYIDIFLSPSLSLRDRVVLCAKVSFFFRLWRLWLLEGDHSVGGNQQKLTQKSMIPLQSFDDIQMSVHYVVLLITLFRDKYPSLSVPLHLTGSDSCEQFFSKVGGMKGHERSYDFMELIDCASAEGRLSELELHDGIVSVGKSHKKHKDIWEKLHPISEGESRVDLRDFSGLETNEMVVHALKEGFLEARTLCTLLEMKPITRNQTWWDRPWAAEVEKRFSFHMGEDLTMHVDHHEVQNIDGEDSEEENVIDMEELEQQKAEEDMIDDGSRDEDVGESELRHVLAEYNDKVMEELDVPFVGDNPKIEQTVTSGGKTLYKSTIVSQLVGNPTLSKDRLNRVKQNVYFSHSIDKKPMIPGTPTLLVYIGSDCGVLFVEKAKRKLPSKKSFTTKKGRPRGTPSNIATGNIGETRMWFIGRVQKIRRKYSGQWGRSREAVDLLDRPGGVNDESVCEVLFNWFRRDKKRTFLYEQVDPQWIDLDTIITVVNMKVHAEVHTQFTLDSHDLKVLDDYVKNTGETVRS